MSAFRLPVGLLLLATIIALCVFLPSNPIDVSNLTIVDRPLPTPLSTRTPPPQPTREHIGRLIFTCTRGDYNQLCMINADGTGYQQLTKLEAHNYYPVYSPLGGSIVYASNQNGGVFDLFLFIFEGRRLIRLTQQIGNVISPSFSPDGKKILFANRAAEGPTSLWTVDNTGENPDLLYAGPNTIVAADWAPVGDRIAFAMAVNQPDAYEIFIMDADGTDARQLTHGLPGIGGSVDWSPDGKHLLIYAGAPGIRISSSSMSMERRLPRSRTEAIMPPVRFRPTVNGLPSIRCGITIRLIYLSCVQMDRTCGRSPITLNLTGSRTGNRNRRVN